MKWYGQNGSIPNQALSSTGKKKSWGIKAKTGTDQPIFCLTNELRRKLSERKQYKRNQLFDIEHTKRITNYSYLYLTSSRLWTG